MKLLTVKMLAGVLNVKPSTIYGQMWKGTLRIPYRKTESGRVLFLEEDVMHWFESLTKKGVEDER
jgi:hypothetical protein